MGRGRGRLHRAGLQQAGLQSWLLFVRTHPAHPPSPSPLPAPAHPTAAACPSFCRGIGDLVLVYKRVTGLAGHTSRVSELLERIKGLSSADEEKTMTRLYL